MSIKYKIIAAIVVVVLINGAALILRNKINQLQTENEILRANNSSLSSGQSELLTKNGLLYSEVQGLIVDKNELKKINVDIYNKLKELDVNYKNTAGVIQVLASENKKLKMALVDSMRVYIKGDTTYIDTLKCFSKIDKYSKISGCIINGDSVDIEYKSEVPLTIVLEKMYKHKFLWFKWGVLNEKLIVTSENKSVTFPTIKLYRPE